MGATCPDESTWGACPAHVTEFASVGSGAARPTDPSRPFARLRPTVCYDQEHTPTMRGGDMTVPARPQGARTQ